MHILKTIIHPLKEFVASCAASWWRVLLLFVVNGVSLNILFWLEGHFTALTGMPVFDTQNELTAVLLQEQLPLYQGAARSAYFRFAAFDFLFPLVGGLVIATIITWLLRHNPLPLANQLQAGSLSLFPFVSTLFDWLENIAFLTLIQLGAAAPTLLLKAAIVAKRLKLAALGASTMLLLVVFVFTLFAFAKGWRRRLAERDAVT